MRRVKALGIASLLVSGMASAKTYDVTKRYQIIDDKLKTEAMLRPIGEDFFIDLGASMNKNVFDFIDDVTKAADKEDINEANAVLLKYEKTEQTVKINANLGFPLPSFTAFNVKFKPNFRVHADVGANAGVRSQQLSKEDILNFFKEDLPAEVRQFILNLDLATYGGQDLRVVCNSETDPVILQYCQDNIPLNKYFIPTLNQKDPVINLLAKADVKAGFFNSWTKGEHFFGEWNLYGMGRADLYQFVTGTQIAAGDKIEKPEELNTEVTLQTDFRFGYKNTNYSIFAGVEEVKISEMKKRKEGSKEHTYGYDALMRLHAEALFRTENLSIKPFAGVHKRSEYDLTDGWYTGVDLGGHVWGDRLGIMMRGMVDNSYFTLSPRLKIWLIQLEYSLKTPVKKEIEDVKLSTLHSVDFRIFF